MEHAVDPEADPQVGLGRLDVDVGRPVGHRLGDEEIDEADDGGLVHRLAGLGDLVGLDHAVGGDLRHLAGLAVEPVEAVEGLEELVFGDDDGLDLGLGQGVDVVEGEDVGGVGHGHHQAPFGPSDGQGPVAAGDGLGDEPDGDPVDRIVGQVDELEAGLGGQGPGQVDLGQLAPLDEDPPEGLPAAGLLGQAGVELVLGDEALGHEQGAEGTTDGHGGVPLPRAPALRGRRGTG